MKLINYLEDDQYPKSNKPYKVREIVRAVILNDNDEVCLTHILADDMFGHRDYYELPGGGIKKGESKLKALSREIKEEVGYETKLIGEIGKVIDFYNLLERENHNYYYLLRATNYVGTSHTQNENRLINKIIWIPFKEAITLVSNHQSEGIAQLLKARELPVLIEAKRLYELKLALDDK